MHLRLKSSNKKLWIHQICISRWCRRYFIFNLPMHALKWIWVFDTKCCTGDLRHTRNFNTSKQMALMQLSKKSSNKKRCIFKFVSTWYSTKFMHDFKKVLKIWAFDTIRCTLERVGNIFCTWGKSDTSFPGNGVKALGMGIMEFHCFTDKSPVATTRHSNTAEAPRNGTTFQLHLQHDSFFFFLITPVGLLFGATFLRPGRVVVDFSNDKSGILTPLRSLIAKDNHNPNTQPNFAFSILLWHLRLHSVPCDSSPLNPKP